MTAVMANGNWDPALSRLLVSLEEARQVLPSSEEEFGFLSGLLQSKELHALVKVHNKIINNGKDEKFHPTVSNSMQIALDVLDVIAPKATSNEDCKNLFILLQKPHIQGLLCAHDAVAQKDYFPRLPEIPLEVDEDEETIKIVQLVKSSEPLSGAQSVEPIVGATIKTDEQTGKIVIARIMHGGAADRSGLIHVGDEVCEVNGINVEGKTPNDVLKILQASEGTITFKLVPADSKSGLRESKVRVRAHFDYTSSTDPYIPCKEAGLDFKKGDILHIVSQDDAYWWQARREGDRNMRAGLIPSRALQERRIIHERTQKEKSGDESLCSVSVLPGCQSPKSPRCASKPKTKKIMYDTAENDDFDREEIATYEEVAKLYPRPGLQRPLVLIGPPGVGRNELKRRLIATDPDKYKTPIPYTSRPPKHGEVNGKDYFFVTREKMEEDIEASKFIEFGEYKGNLYGTSAESVKSLVNAGYVCILNPHYQALKMLRTPQLKPYIIYIKPPTFDILKETRNAAYARSTFDETNSRGFTDEEFHEILHSSERIEFLYSHLFDEVIVNADLSVAFEQLVRVASKVETEPLWVPASWVQ
ncbi:MAGUK p55 subfamily member 7 isoform X5 [Schistocerca nitens]|uniref:MAGUK p55 subfamily member 7 isoform X5 n=1 Tax=Schistocerca cancellata TaxID=274614 RepID=UPI002118E8C1|nr:MAGUK p55 subfamily member 7 isoform X5 [Schistocerca cancellata]XP_049814252.1 MAGUK p55 subfamily member 7 isoform X5 [Schistocerca nitens]XP_049828250.1 MAGUK p55 subfamily member 7 isoform X6 [Schistocerca gregaria]XP_049828251.1 MAGUK p55 subfamily member 7 isoform X6 [Schistocerca gregaria]